MTFTKSSFKCAVIKMSFHLMNITHLTNYLYRSGNVTMSKTTSTTFSSLFKPFNIPHVGEIPYVGENSLNFFGLVTKK